MSTVGGSAERLASADGVVARFCVLCRWRLEVAIVCKGWEDDGKDGARMDGFVCVGFWGGVGG